MILSAYEHDILIKRKKLKKKQYKQTERERERERNNKENKSFIHDSFFLNSLFDKYYKGRE